MRISSTFLGKPCGQVGARQAGDPRVVAVDRGQSRALDAAESSYRQTTWSGLIPRWS
jgi:hypothetical protein